MAQSASESKERAREMAPLIPQHEANRLACSEVVYAHYNHPAYEVAEFLAGASTLKAEELNTLGDVRGRTLLHLMCHFGLDTLSWAREGAIVTGVDISDRAIERADELAHCTGLAARFVRSDVLALPEVLDEQFEIVFQSLR